MRATIGHGLPFAYFQITGGNAQITHRRHPDRLVQQRRHHRLHRSTATTTSAYAPTGATWTVTRDRITSTLAGKGYFSVAVLPTDVGSATDARRPGHHLRPVRARPRDRHPGLATPTTRRPARSTTTYAFTTTAREGTATRTVVSLYPHQWKSLTGATPIAQTYVVGPRPR